MEMPFWELRRVVRRNHVLDVVQIPEGMGNFGGWPPPHSKALGVTVYRPQRTDQYAMYRNYGIESNQILHCDKDHKMLFVIGPNTRIANLRWRMAAT